MTIASTRYAEPRHVVSLHECSFYHSIDLPEGTVEGAWDLRATAREYLGNFEFAGKRVLDAGTASGFLTFWMEQQGAEVVSFDMATGDQWETVPYVHPDYNQQEVNEWSRYAHERTVNSYWYAHERLGSRARAYYGLITSIPPALGPFEVVVLGTILPHLRDPFGALAALAPLAGEAMVITQPSEAIHTPFARFLPNPATQRPHDAWWGLSEGCLRTMLSVLGFDVERVVRAKHRRVLEGWDEECAALVARRRPIGARPAPLVVETEPIPALTEPVDQSQIVMDAQRDELRGLRAEVGVLRADLAARRDEMGARDAHVRQQEVELAELRTRSAAQALAIEAYRRDLELAHSTRAWRLASAWWRFKRSFRR